MEVLLHSAQNITAFSHPPLLLLFLKSFSLQTTRTLSNGVVVSLEKQ